MIYGLVLKLHLNNHPDPLSPSEEIQHKSGDKTVGTLKTTVIERDSHVIHHLFCQHDNKCLACASVRFSISYVVIVLNSSKL